MKNTKSEMAESRKQVCYSLLENAVLLFILLLLFRPAYETNDDMGMALIVNGAKGVYDPHLIFSHYFLGLLLSVLYRITDQIPWYPILQYAVLFLSFTAVTYVCRRREQVVQHRLIKMLLLIVFAYEGYINLQFTKTAGIASAAGMFLIFYAIAGQKLKKGALAAGMLIACLGSMYRMHQFLAEGFLMTGIGVFQLLRLHKEEKKKRLKKICLYFGTFALLLFFAFGLKTIDQKIYDRDPSWQEFCSYNKLRGKLYDYGFPAYRKNKELYQSYGVNKAAYKLYRSWAHMDPDYFTIELMESLYEAQPKKKLDLDFFENFLKKVPVSFLKIPVFYCCVCVLLFWIFFGKKSWSRWLTTGYEGIAVMIMYLYLYYRGRYLLNRVDVGLWFAAFLTLIWISEKYSRQLSRWAGCLTAILLLGGYQVIWQGHYRWNSEDELIAQKAERAVLDTIAADPEHLYLTKPTIVSFVKAYGVFERIPFGSAKNIYSLGGWTSASPVYAAVLDSFDIRNPFEDMIANEKVYLIDHKLDLTMNYIQKYYDETAEAELVFTYAPYQVYRITSDW